MRGPSCGAVQVCGSIANRLAQHCNSKSNMGIRPTVPSHPGDSGSWCRCPLPFEGVPEEHTAEITFPSLPRSSSQHPQKYLRLKLVGKLTSGLLWLLCCKPEANLAKLLKMDGWMGSFCGNWFSVKQKSRTLKKNNKLVINCFSKNPI